MRQDCETLNNILLSELDYFSTVMVEDFQSVLLKLLKEQAEYHKKVNSVSLCSLNFTNFA